MKYPAKKTTPLTRFHGAKQAGPANPPFYWHYVIVKTRYIVSKWKDSTYVCDFIKILICLLAKPAYHPTSLKVKNMHNFGAFQPIWLKFGIDSLNGRTQHMYVI